MLMLPPGSRVFLATQSVDGRKGIDGLSALVRSRFGQDPLTGTLFVFFSKRVDRVRVLYWDRDGCVLTMKRLDRGTFRFPSTIPPDGLTLRTPRARWVRATRRHRPHSGSDADAKRAAL